MFSGIYDRIVDIETNREYIGSIPSVIEHNEINADHLTFFIGKDTTYFDRVLELIEKFNGKG